MKKTKLIDYYEAKLKSEPQHEKYTPMNFAAFLLEVRNFSMGMPKITAEASDMDALLKEGSSSMDEAQRNEAYAKAMDIANANCPYVFLMYPLRACVMSNAYTGLRMNSSWNWNMFFNEITPAQ